MTTYGLFRKLTAIVKLDTVFINVPSLVHCTSFCSLLDDLSYALDFGNVRRFIVLCPLAVGVEPRNVIALLRGPALKREWIKYLVV